MTTEGGRSADDFRAFITTRGFFARSFEFWSKGIGFALTVCATMAMFELLTWSTETALVSSDLALSGSRRCLTNPLWFCKATRKFFN
jgi:hypothetical protein